jgi:hypothetical protein
MPTSIPGSSSSFPANITAPSDGDTRNAASVATALGQLADRTAYLKAKAGIDDNGAKRIRTVADVSALKAIGSSDRADKDVALVLGTGSGLYVFSSGSSITGDDMNVVQPTTGTGRWINIDYFRRGWDKGVAPIDENGVVPDQFMPYQCGRVDCSGASPTYSGNVASASFETWTGGYKKLRVNLDVARPSAEYPVLVTAYEMPDPSPKVFLQATPVDADTFDVFAWDGSNGKVSLDAGAIKISFFVAGG